MTTRRFAIGEDSIDSILTGVFAVSLTLSAGVLGYELGAMAAGSAGDPVTLAVLSTGGLASAVGLRRVGGGCIFGRCRLR